MISRPLKGGWTHLGTGRSSIKHDNTPEDLGFRPISGHISEATRILIIETIKAVAEYGNSPEWASQWVRKGVDRCIAPRLVNAVFVDTIVKFE